MNTDKPFKDTDIREALRRRYANTPKLPDGFMASMEQRMAEGEENQADRPLDSEQDHGPAPLIGRRQNTLELFAFISESFLSPHAICTLSIIIIIIVVGCKGAKIFPNIKIYTNKMFPNITIARNSMYVNIENNSRNSYKHTM